MRRRRAWLLAIEFVLLVVLSHGLGIALLRDEAFASFGESRSYVEALRRVSSPSVGDWYVAYDRGSADHHALWHDVLGTSAILREADVIALGNSRTLAAFDPEVLVPFFEARGQRYYNLAFAHGERVEFPEKIFAALDLQPAVVIINADGFFGSGMSRTGTAVAAMSRFDAMKHVYEKWAGFTIRRQLHELYPLVARAAGSEWIALRSIEHGSWLVEFEHPTPRAISLDQSGLSEGAEQAFVDAMALQLEPMMDAFRSRGTRVVLTLVPRPKARPAVARRLAAQLGVPFLEISPRGLEVADNSHLTRDSARRFSRRLVEHFGHTIEADPE